MSEPGASPQFKLSWDEVEADLRIRLSDGRQIGVTGPDRVGAAFRMMRRGEVACHWGDGADRGVLLVRATSSAT